MEACVKKEAETTDRQRTSLASWRTTHSRPCNDIEVQKQFKQILLFSYSNKQWRYGKQ